MSTLETYYTYAKLAQAAYIDLSPFQLTGGATPKDPQTIAKAGNDQERLPDNLGKQMFPSGSVPTDGTWAMLDPYYKSSEATGHSDPTSGYAGMLVSNAQYGKVLAIAGTEPGAPWQTWDDLASSDVLQIGFLGAALKQIVSLYNHIQELRAPKNAIVTRLEVMEEIAGVGTTLPPVGTYVQFGARIFRLIDRNDGVGRQLLSAGETITITGHSLGGHVAAMAAALFPDLITKAYTFNAPGYNPPTSRAQALGANGILDMFRQFGASPLTVATAAGRVIRRRATIT